MLETTEGNYRTFRKGDAVFFSGAPWMGSAVGYYDGYVKVAELAFIKDEKIFFFVLLKKIRLSVMTCSSAP